MLRLGAKCYKGNCFCRLNSIFILQDIYKKNSNHRDQANNA